MFSTRYNLVTLRKTGLNHLWTVPPEAKLCLFIPLFSLFSYKLKIYFIIWASCIIIFLYLSEVYNINGLKCTKITHQEGENLQRVFQIFLTGSLVGVIYYEIQNCSLEFKIFNKLKFLLAYINPIMFILELRSGIKSYNPDDNCYIMFGIYWAFYILFLLLGDRSCFNEIINLSIFKKFGKYSFGIYLFICERLCLTIDFFFDLYSFDNFNRRWTYRWVTHCFIETLLIEQLLDRMIRLIES